MAKRYVIFMRNIARFVVDTHSHISTLYQPEGEHSLQLEAEGRWNGMNGRCAVYDNSDFAIADMDRYGVDIAVLLPSMIGTTNESQIKIMDKYPDRFASCCADSKTAIKYYMDRSLKYNFQESLDEVEEALQTGRFVGIGEFAPGLILAARGVIAPPTIEERMEQWRGICRLAQKYDVPVHFHDFMMPFNCKEGEHYDLIVFLENLLKEFPKVNIIANHGYKEPNGIPIGPDDDPVEHWVRFYTMTAKYKNVFLECGGWCEKNFELAFGCGMRACNIIWGHDYGNVPQYLFRREHFKHMQFDPKRGLPKSDAKIWDYRSTDSLFGGIYDGFSAVPTYQPDFYGWGLRIIDRVGDWLTQDEINLIMGGTAARLYKLPVPRSRMFAEARPDIFGENWREDWYPFIPDSQIQNPDGFHLPPFEKK